MTLSGLTANDAGVTQYQLCMVDPSREQHPVDGGVVVSDGPLPVVGAVDA